MLLLEQDITKKERIDNMPKLDTNNKNSREYKVEPIWDIAVYKKNLKVIY